MNKLNKVSSELKNVIESQDKYDFPNFLEALRKSLCLNRQTVTKDLNISAFKLSNLEYGYFRHPIDTELLSEISNYFGVDKIVLQKKMDKFLSQKRFKIAKK